jgi:nicotinamidase-related amidase
MRVELLIIDPQQDFCNPQGSLFVEGADKDIERITTMINRLNTKIDDIHVTLDSHRLIDVAHPAYWKNSEGKNPDPFTIITYSDVENGVWTTTHAGLYKKGLNYVQSLEKNGRYPLCIWPPHCLIGSEGATIVPELHKALCDWELKNFGVVDYVTKGSNPHTEHYSGVRADVPDPNDPSTQLNTALIETLEQSDLVAVCGEASSHCLANTVRDIVNSYGDPACVKKLVLLKNGCSPVPGFENLEVDFIKDMTSKGMQVTTCEEFLA